MQPDHVPRRRERWGASTLWHESDEDENGQRTISRQESWLPSSDLQEELEAMILRRAHKKLLQQTVSSELNAEVAISSLARTRQLHQASDESQNSITSETTSEGEDFSSVSDGTTTDVDRKRTRSRRSSSNSQLSSRSESLPSPTMLLDDQLAASALRPSVRECMGRLNCLLDTLHRSRKGGRESVTLTENQFPDVPKAKRRRRGPSVAEDGPSLDKTEARTTTSVTPSGHIRPVSNLKNMACRDWSEILNLAVATGWDQAAVERTAQRCAILFGETMEFRCISRHATPQAQSKSFIHLSAPAMPERSTAASMSGTSRTYACSYSRCERHRESFTQRWELRQHLKRSHKLSDAEIERILIPMDESHYCSGQGVSEIESQRKASRDDILCPITICMPNSRC
jgi:hypothetical protein